jgi:glycosyltransferase involved in cell wall biosynthesis
MKTIYFTVTNDLSYDQRMHRICTTLVQKGHTIWLIGRVMPGSEPMSGHLFLHHRLRCYFNRGKAFYIEYNLRLLFFLLFRRMDAVCAVDLDTILPVYIVSIAKKIPRVYDAHEWFTEMKEVVTRPFVHKAWRSLERWMVPRFPQGYTVSQPIAEYFRLTYHVEYPVIRNLPVAKPWPPVPENHRIIIYQGAVNEGRCFEELIPAMSAVKGKLHIYGDGNFLRQARQLTRALKLEEKIFFMGKFLPAQLSGITPAARAGITVFEKTGKSNRYSLANRFFDYIQAGVPQVCSDLPCYREINQEHEVAVLLSGQTGDKIAHALNNLLDNEVLYLRLRSNCMNAARQYTWENESIRLIRFYQNLLH